MASREFFELDNYHTFRYHLSQLVESRGLEYKQVAEAVGLTNVSLSRYMSGVRKPELYYIIRIAQYFNVSLEWLIGYNVKNSATATTDKELLDKYSFATDDDKKLINEILSKYEVED